MIYRLYILEGGLWTKRVETMFSSYAFDQWQRNRAQTYALLVYMPGYEKTGVFAMWSRVITREESDLLSAQIMGAA